MLLCIHEYTDTQWLTKKLLRTLHWTIINLGSIFLFLWIALAIINSSYEIPALHINLQKTLINKLYFNHRSCFQTIYWMFTYLTGKKIYQPEWLFKISKLLTEGDGAYHIIRLQIIVLPWWEETGNQRNEQMIQNFQTVRTNQNERTPSKHTPQYPNGFSWKLLFHYLSNQKIPGFFG